MDATHLRIILIVVELDSVLQAVCDADLENSELVATMSVPNILNLILFGR